MATYLERKTRSPHLIFDQVVCELMFNSYVLSVVSQYVNYPVLYICLKITDTIYLKLC